MSTRSRRDCFHISLSYQLVVQLFQADTVPFSLTNKMSVCLQNNSTGPHLSSTVFLRKDVNNYVCGDQGCNYCFRFSEKEVGSLRGCRLLSRCVADLGRYGSHLLFCAHSKTILCPRRQLVYKCCSN